MSAIPKKKKVGKKVGKKKIFVKNTKSSVNTKTTLEKGGRNPPNVTLDVVLEDLLTYFNVKILHETKKEIEKKYDINKECDDCWPEDDIKRAWGKARRIDKDLRRKRWSVVILLQLLKIQKRKEESSLNESGHLVQRCTELSLKDMHDQMKAARENGRGEDCLRSTDDINQACGKAESMKEKSEDRSTQSRDELKIVGAAGGVRHSGGKHPTSSYLWQTSEGSQFWTGTQFSFPVTSQATGNGAPDSQSRTLESEEENTCRNETTYIRIPYVHMFANEPTFRGDTYISNTSRYKLISEFPSDNMHISRSYAMSFDNYTSNAELVYEILNRDTLVDNIEQERFGQGYDKGHLAAAANHRWCREAYNDTYLSNNIIPQNNLLNRGLWKKLENRCRKLTKNNEIRNVHVYTGPLYLRPMLNFEFEGKIVPSHLFKVITVENMNWTVREPECYVIPNEPPQNNDLNDYSMNIENFQRVSGLTIIERRPNLGDIVHIMTVSLQGQDLNAFPCIANLGVRITG